MISIRAGVDFDNMAGMGLPDGSVSELYVGDPFADPKMDVAMLLKEAVRVLKPNGMLCFDYIAPISKEYLEDAFRGLMKATEVVPATDSDLTKVTYTKIKKVPTAFFKADDEERIVYYSVLSPWKLDMDGHYFTPEAIANACGKFDKIRKNIDINHSFEFLDGVEVIDNFIATGDEDFEDSEGEMVKMHPGDWIIGLHMVDDMLWKGVKDGTYSGVSLAGQGLMVEGNFAEVVLNG
jgi:SAM-dependent methyltransferase